jgi:hypothetical protein
MTGQMSWVSKFGGNGELILHLRLTPHQPWKPYSHFIGLKVPDHPIAGGSKGFATCQQLLKAGWTLIPTPQAQHSLIDSNPVDSQNAA